MALSVLDGNQSATTLSSVVTGGEHIVAHSVVSLGSNAISNIATAVSGSTVCVGNLGLLQSTVATDGLSASGSFIKIGGHTGTSTTGHIVHVSAVGALRVDGSVYTQPVSIASVTIGNTVTIAGTVTANPTGTQTIAGTVTANVPLVDVELGGGVTQGIPVYLAGGKDGVVIDEINYINNILGTVTIAGTVTANPTGTQTIAGTVTANLTQGINSSSLTSVDQTKAIAIQMFNEEGAILGGSNEPLKAYPSGLGTALAEYANNEGINYPLPISGTVTANVLGKDPQGSNLYQIPVIAYDEGIEPNGLVIPVQITNGGGTLNSSNPLPISGTVTANTFALQGTAVTTSNFTSTTASTVLAGYNATREVLTIFNEGAGNLHICAGATCTTIAYQVRLSAGDYYEVPNHQTTITHSAVFATAGTARVTQLS